MIASGVARAVPGVPSEAACTLLEHWMFEHVPVGWAGDVTAPSNLSRYQANVPFDRLDRTQTMLE